jgi:hypothetical protein
MAGQSSARQQKHLSNISWDDESGLSFPFIDSLMGLPKLAKLAKLEWIYRFFENNVKGIIIARNALRC